MEQRDIDRFWSKVDKTGPCWLWAVKSKDWDGYGLYTYREGGKRWSVRSHRVAWELHHGQKPGKFMVCHKCDIPACVNPDHLFLGTAGDNFRDCLRKGRYSPKGMGNAAAKLTNEDVIKILELYVGGGWTQRALADAFGVHQGTVSAIVRGQNWKHVGEAWYGT